MGWWERGYWIGGRGEGGLFDCLGNGRRRVLWIVGGRWVFVFGGEDVGKGGDEMGLLCSGLGWRLLWGVWGVFGGVLVCLGGWVGWVVWVLWWGVGLCLLWVWCGGGLFWVGVGVCGVWGVVVLVVGVWGLGWVFGCGVGVCVCLWLGVGWWLGGGLGWVGVVWGGGVGGGLVCVVC